MSETMCNRILEYREKNGSESFFDVKYADLVNDPIKVVKEIYAAAGHTYTETFDANMQQYIKENPQGKHGRNKYNLELYGLEEEDMQRRFAKYRKTYGV